MYSVAIPSAVTFVVVRRVCICLENQSTITQIVLYPLDSSNSLIKLTDITCQGLTSVLWECKAFCLVVCKDFVC